jgi:hypothetical protein
MWAKLTTTSGGTPSTQVNVSLLYSGITQEVDGQANVVMWYLTGPNGTWTDGIQYGSAALAEAAMDAVLLGDV